MTAGNHRVDDRFRLARLARGLSQGALADMAGVTRQSISGIESGRWSPSLEVALALAAALGTSIEDLFGAAPELPALEPGSPPRRRRRRACCCRRSTALRRVSSGRRLRVRPRLPARAGAMRPGTHRARGFAHRTQPIAALRPTLAIAGCDPALALLAGPLERHRPANSLVWWACNNTAGPRLLKAGHGARRSRSPARRRAAAASVRSRGRRLRRLARGPRRLHEIRQVGARARRRARARSPARQPRAGLGGPQIARRGTRRARCGADRLSGYDTACSAHLLVASSIAAGLADIGVASEPAALAYGLGFVAWQEEICELHVPRSLLGTPEIRALLDVLAGSELPAQLGRDRRLRPRSLRQAFRGVACRHGCPKRRPRTAEARPARRRVNVVPHTHWDREWYAPFRTFQLRLVDLVDGLLELMESDPSYAHFLLDGQMAAVDDYLEVRPENEGRLRRLAASGRITFGPWYVLMDEFLVSGETIVRNLQLGLERAAAFGGAMEVGYLPDMFGHVAQMPQLLSGCRLRGRRRVAGRALGGRQDRLHVGGPGRFGGPGRVPPRRLLDRCRGRRRRQGVRAAAAGPSRTSARPSSSGPTRPSSSRTGRITKSPSPGSVAWWRRPTRFRTVSTS